VSIRLLILSPTLPYPLDSGGNIRLYHIAKRLSSAFEIHLLPGLLPQSADHERALKAETGIAAIHPVEKVGRWTLRQRLWRRVDFWRYSPHSISLDEDPHYAETLKQLLRRYPFDVGLVVNLYMFQYRKYLAGFPVFYNANDVESVKYRRWYKGESLSPKRQLLYALQRVAITRFEARVAPRSAAVFVTSPTDGAHFQRLGGRGRILVAPNGVDLDYFRARTADSFSGRPRILFMGSFFYKPNLQAAVFLRDQLMPRLRAEHPEVSLDLVGNTAGVPEVAAWHDPPSGVYFHGRVGDVRPLLQSCQVFVCPIFIGSGTRIKVLEAMATGTPVVATSMGAEGIESEDQQGIVIADSVERMAAVVSKLLRSRELCAQVGHRGRELVEQRYSWDVAARVMADTIGRSVQRREFLTRPNS
jgi:glycosyltransferase involved in cell wall biosynthesis